MKKLLTTTMLVAAAFAGSAQAMDSDFSGPTGRSPRVASSNAAEPKLTTKEMKLARKAITQAAKKGAFEDAEGVGAFAFAQTGNEKFARDAARRAGESDTMARLFSAPKRVVGKESAETEKKLTTKAMKLARKAAAKRAVNVDEESSDGEVIPMTRAQQTAQMREENRLQREENRLQDELRFERARVAQLGDELDRVVRVGRSFDFDSDNPAEIIELAFRLSSQTGREVTQEKMRLAKARSQFDQEVQVAARGLAEESVEENARLQAEIRELKTRLASASVMPQQQPVAPSLFDDVDPTASAVPFQAQGSQDVVVKEKPDESDNDSAASGFARKKKKGGKD